MKPIIRLPTRENSMQPIELYFEDEENQISDIEIYQVLQDFIPIQVRRERLGGYISFKDMKSAEKAYSFYNGYVFPNNAIFKLCFKDTQQPEGSILQVRNLPDDIDHHQLYDVCRPFGVLAMCKVIKQGMGLVQYVTRQDSDACQYSLNNKVIEGCLIQVTILMANNMTNPMQLMSQEESHGYVDYMNLYVKNLDLSIQNQDLFQLFRPYGRIVSARVMSHPVTGLSKGYGFVSFSKPEEAAAALEAMNGFMVRLKSMTVAYHEPKRKNPIKSSSSTTTSSAPSNFTPIDYPPPYFEPHEFKPCMMEMEEPMHLKDMASIPLQRKASAIDYHPLSPAPCQFTRPSLASLASGASIQPPPVEHKGLKRKGSMESIMTETSAQMQRMKMTEAVKRVGAFGSQLDNVVDMLLTLKRKERSLCLFNQEFLKDKIQAAVEALEVFDEEEDEEENDEDFVSGKRSMDSRVPSPPQTYSLPPPKPVVAINEAPTEISNLLISLEGKPLHEQKQLLGDQLFPLVKATGVRHAPKVTIRLLDTVQLEELARIMFHKDMLKSQIDKL
ncbi:hypothetical protein G6F48_005735 [Rhizopus delemar]|nr:hypothetical protein G6F48_005735 [Rhizopus delemar]